MIRDFEPGDPIVYEDARGTCRWGIALSEPKWLGQIHYPLIRVQLKDELPQWVPLRSVYRAHTRELPAWARWEAA